jgi:hypothetical protein
MCHKLELQPDYSDERRKEDVGGLVRDPAGETFTDVWYIDVTSLYPAIIIMFNMFANPKITPHQTEWFTGNKVFEIKGKYGLEYNPMSEEYKVMFTQRVPLKIKNPKLAYAYKILMNCFSEDTEMIMSDGSIKLVKDAKVGEYVKSMNPFTLEIQEKKIIKTYEYDYHGEMYEFKSLYYDFLVTPEHRFLTYAVSGINNPKFIKAEDLFNVSRDLAKGKYYYNLRENVTILEHMDKNDFSYVFTSTKHNRIWLNKYDIKRTKKNYNGYNQSYNFSYREIKDKLDVLMKDTTINIKIKDKNRKCEYSHPIKYPI